jgi:hypothetical protein
MKKKFILKAIIFSVLILSTVFGVIYIQPIDKDKYLMVLLDKHRILATTPQPRIIFVGDSSLAFGLDSAMVRKATGYNVVNMGLHGGLGLIYIMDELKPYLKKDDIVVFALDYTHYIGLGTGDNTLIEVTIVMPWIIKYYSRENYMPFINNIPVTFQRRLSGLLSPSKEGPGHRRSGFNEYGDNIGHIGLKSDAFKGMDFIAKYVPQARQLNMTRFLPGRVNDIIVTYMNRFSAYWEPRGVKIYLAYSPLMENDRPKQEKTLQSLDKDIRARIKMKVIGSPLTYIYPQKYFYDNEFHLNGEGRELRSEQLLKDMKADPVLSRAPGR